MRVAVALVVCVVAASCSRSPVYYDAGTHVVQRGETLYTIAWRHGVDYRALAQWNRLSNPDLIYVGQRLRLTSPTAARTSAPAPRTSRPAAASAPRSIPPPPVLPAPDWSWPTAGPIVRRFGAADGITSGIGIGGREGQAVNAAATGRVVYAGSGLIGYGQLVIVKHNDTFLSAYGHNARLLVAQGDDVRRGQKIAEMGLGPDRRPRLHFEIRRNGTPVDPTPYLNAAR